MAESRRVLSSSSGSVAASIMFVGEAPGRLGADASGIPFHGDAAGNNFEDLLSGAGLTRDQLFITNAVLCNPKDERGNNAPPSRQEIENCAPFLAEQINLVNPRIVVTLGATALQAVNLIEPHGLALGASVRTQNTWLGRALIPLYHPGQRAMLHRSFANQRVDYRYVAEAAFRGNRKGTQSVTSTRPRIVAVVRTILSLNSPLSYFALHKLFYLCELRYFAQHARRMTDAYFIRQKDGPYCVDLQITRLKKAIPELCVSNNRLSAGEGHPDLLAATTGPLADEDAAEVVRAVVRQYGHLDDSALKSRAYLSTPMRRLLRKEKEVGRALLNVPIAFGDRQMQNKGSVRAQGTLI